MHRGNKLPAAARLDSILEAPADVEPDHVLDALAQHQNLLQVLRDDIALYHPRILDGAKVEKFSIVPRLRQSIASDRVGGILHEGSWDDVGTPERLEALQSEFGS